MFHLDQTALPIGVGKQGYLRAIPRRVRSLFGDPVHYPNDDECLGSFVFKSESGEVCTLYCMAYDLPEATTEEARAEFWDYSGVVDLHVGAKTQEAGKRFRTWAEEQLFSGPPL
jgi:hypothetical protein